MSTRTKSAPRDFGALGRLAIAALALALLASCAPGRDGVASAADPRTVIAYTEGLVSFDARIRVVLAAQGDSVRAAQASPANPFSFDPPIKGSVSWEDDRTVAFVPEASLGPGRVWKARFDPAVLGFAAGAAPFDFGFRTAPATLSLELEPLRPGAEGGYVLEGRLRSNSGGAAVAFEKALSLRGAKGARVEWGELEGGVRGFAITGLEARDKAGELRLAWNGAALDASGRGEERIRLPARGEFLLTGSRSSVDPERVLELSFSKPLDPEQDLRGLIVPAGYAPGAGPALKDLRFERSGGVLAVYSGAEWPEGATLRLEPGLRAADGSTLAIPVVAAVDTVWQKPLVRFGGQGTILPSGDGAVLPLETLNVSGVIVQAFRVFDDAMLQFLQVNELDEGEELLRVGEPVWQERVELPWDEGMRNRWVARGLDLGPLTRKFGSGMFQIRVSFRKDQTRYSGGSERDFSSLPWPDDSIPELDEREGSFWDWAEQWAGDDDPYRFRNDPNHPAYYVRSYDHDITVRRNVLVSDLALVMRREADGSWRAAASNLKSAAPLAGADVRLYSYARRELTRASTDAKGFTRLTPASGAKPAFAELRAGTQTTWMKVDSGSALATSHFDSGGEKAVSGVKGFIYAERGVWRPGDAMRLVFVLHDPERALPAEHPVTFELLSPSGGVIRSEVLRAGIDGFYRIDPETAPDAPTGDWTARFAAGGRTWAKSLKVESIMPNRLKASLDLGGAATLSAKVRSLGIESAWLHGAPASGLRADVAVAFDPMATSFSSFSGYAFDDATRRLQASSLSTIWEGTLDEAGKARFPVDLAPEGLAPGRLRASFLTRVHESSGVFSSESFSTEFDPYERYVGLKLPKGDEARGMLLTDVDHVAEIALLDTKGVAVPKGSVEVALYKLEWRWWWEKGEESLAEYARELYRRPLLKGTVDIVNGRGRWTFQLKYPEWGRYLVRVEDKSGGHAASTIVYMDWPGWAGRGRPEAGGSAQMLSLATDKTSYRVGETATVTFPANARGRALVAVERSGKVLREEWVPGTPETARFSFKVESGMAPNVYVHVMFLQEYGQTANSLPIRLYGIVPIMVDDPGTRLEPVLKAPDRLTPNASSVFTVREAAGKPMTYTVAVVDEGLLGLTRFRAQNPRDAFYKKEASILATFDMYKHVAGAWPGKLETLLAIGGSDGLDGKAGRKPERFPPVVRFYGPFRLASGATAEHKLELGPYVGAVRYMVVAGHPSGAYGVAEKSVTVSSELMAFATAPRFLSVDETAIVPVNLFVGAGKPLALTVTASAEGAVRLDGAAIVKVEAPRDGEYSAAFTIKSGGSVGSGRLRVVAEGSGYRSEHVIDLPVRSASTTLSVAKTELVEAGKRVSLDLAFPGVPGSNSLAVELSRVRPVDLSGRLAFLIGYPHGCAEQTVSRAFPQVFLPEAFDLDPAQKEAVLANVRVAIDKLPDFQTQRGGFSYWPGEGYEHDWLSSYVGHFLVSAERASFMVPADLKSRLLDYLAGAATLWSSAKPEAAVVQAYRLYVLALAGKGDLAAMNRLRESGTLPSQATWRLAAAYALSGRKDAADALIRGIQAKSLVLEAQDALTWGSPERDEALILDALNALGDKARGKPLFDSLADRLAGSGWLSTQESAWALIAVLPWIRDAAPGGSSTATLVFAGGREQSVSFARGVKRVDLALGAQTGGALVVQNLGPGPLWVRAISRGEPKPGSEPFVSNGLGLDLVWQDAEGHRIDPSSLRLGDDARIAARVSNLTVQPVSDVALTLRIPAGFEIVNERLATASDEGEASTLARYQDIRDDRSLWYFDLKRGESKSFILRVTRSYDGTFAMPAASVEAMYDGTINAVAPGSIIGPAASVKSEATKSSGFTPRWK